MVSGGSQHYFIIIGSPGITHFFKNYSAEHAGISKGKMKENKVWSIVNILKGRSFMSRLQLVWVLHQRADWIAFAMEY